MEEQQANKHLHAEVSGLAGARSTAEAWCKETTLDLSQLIQSKHEECKKIMQDFGRRCETLECKLAGPEGSFTTNCSLAERALDTRTEESPRQTSLIRDLAIRMDRLEVIASAPNIGHLMIPKTLGRIGSSAQYEVKEDEVPVFDTPDHNRRKTLACLHKGEIVTVQQKHKTPVGGGQFFDVYGLIDAPLNGWILLQYERRCGMVDWIG